MVLLIKKPDEVIPEILKLDRDTVYDFKITKHREKRSLDANAYYQVLISEISKALNQDRQKVHLMMLKSQVLIL